MTINDEIPAKSAALDSASIKPVNRVRCTGDTKTPTPSPEPIAICGFAMRLPGGVRNSNEFWEVLRHGKDMRGPVPSDRYNAKGFDNTLGSKGAIETQFGYFLQEDLSCLDTSFFSMTKNELEKTDPQIRQLLEVTRECLESAGETEYRGKPVGVYLGTFGENWLEMLTRESQHHGGYALHVDLMLANRVSYEYDLTGPSMVIKTGCSASLVALHEACRAMQNGDCCSAIVAGTNLIIGPTMTSIMTQEGILSPSGSCKTFDATADGFARGEAITAIYLKRLDDAVNENTPIRAIIRGTGTNSDGKSQGIMNPKVSTQEALMRKVYSEAGLDPRETAYVECHGTGTPTGDPIETAAVARVFGGENGVYIGSVKANFGHSEGASGLTSIIKAVLALENQIIPPQIKFTCPNPKIPFAEKHLKVPITATPWPSNCSRRVSINSFGIGGTNSHVIVDSVLEVRPDLMGAAVKPAPLKDSPQLLLFSANTQDSLRRHASNVQEYLKLHPGRLSDLAYTLALRREHLPHRAFSVVEHGSVANVSPFSKTPSSPAKIVMIFTGQGSQWPEMAYDLIQTDPFFRQDIIAMDRILQGLEHSPNWTIEGEIRKPGGASQLHKAEIAQPACTAIQIALVNALNRNGVQPQAVIGHSSGEIVAAYAAGALSVSEAMIVAYYRGYITKSQKLEGGMAAVGLDAISTSKFLTNGVVVACENSPISTTISGDVLQLKTVLKEIKQQNPDVLVRQLKVDMAYHSHHMKSLVGQYIKLVRDEIKSKRLIRNELQATFVSSVTGQMISSADLSPEYWASNLTSRVRFEGAVKTYLLQQSKNIFLEVGPHSTLAGPLRQICAEAQTPCPYVSTMVRGSPSAPTLLAAFGQLYQQGSYVDFTSLMTQGKVLTDLPCYPWDHAASYWYESRVSKDFRFRAFGHHILLGEIVPESTSLDPCWRVVLALEDAPFLYDHRVVEDIVFPFAGYIAMAGEAIRQITGVETGYSLRHIVAHTALVMTDSKPTEIVTTLRRHKLTDSSDSNSYDFVISSYSGSTWIKHCDGRVMPIEKSIRSSASIPVLPRNVDVSRWYDTLARIGLVFGVEFQCLTKISSSTSEDLAGLAVAEVTNSTARQTAPFTFHPAAIDACLQLTIAAIAKGEGRNLKQLFVPTVIEELEVSRSSTDMIAKAWCSTDMENVGVDCVADGKTVLRLRGLRMNPLDNDKSLVQFDDRHAARLEWSADFDFLDVRPLFNPPVSSNEAKLLLEELTLLCILESAERLEGLTAGKPHFIKFRDWLNREIRRAESNTYPVVENALSFIRLPRSTRLEWIKDRVEKAAKTASVGDAIATVASGVIKICDNAENLFTGEIDALSLLMEGNVLTEIYNAVSFGHGDFVKMLCNTRPYLRILEVGAGTGGTTELILRNLVRSGSGSNPPYATYTFTDISAGFFPQARERFSYAPNMDYKVLDISRSPVDQGFAPDSFDLVLAPNVIHATANLQDTLRNLRPLLRSNGYLVLSEVCAVGRGPNYIFSNFEGWWLGEADGRVYEPYVSVDRWDRELKGAGFTGADTAIYDGEEPFHYCALIVTRPVESKLSLNGNVIEPRSRPITLLCERPNMDLNQRLIQDIRQQGIDVSITTLGSPIPLDQDVISTLDLEKYFFENITEERFIAFQDLLRRHKSQKILWLMPLTQIHCVDPRSAQSIGMIRTARAELAIPFMTLEIEATEKSFSDLVMQVFQKIRRGEDADNLAPDKEFVVDKGIIKIGRYQPFSLQEEICEKSNVRTNQVKYLEIVKPGLLESFQWTERARPITIPRDRVEIETRAVSINFRDVLYVMGLMSFVSGSALAVEASGVVTRVGEDVGHRVTVGDRVIAVSYTGCFNTHVIAKAPLTIKIPDEMSFEVAASMPACYLTTIRSIIDICQLAKGQSILIHSACGGVGHAAIQLSKMIGAEIFATVGSEEKKQYLVEYLGILPSHIFKSRDDSFLDDLMHETGGRGVDVVLNSLSGELLHASWKCVAEFGTMIELGKRDLAGYGKLDMEVFLPNRSYCCVDIGHWIRDRPVQIGGILERMLDMWQKGLIQSPGPIAQFPASEVENSFRHLQGGNNIGKTVVQLPEDPSKIPSVPRAKPTTFDQDASYILTGGLGGIGKALAAFMIERGARSLIFLARSAGSGNGDKEFFVELESMGCSVNVFAGGVHNLDDVKNAILKAARPIKGVVHLAMVLQDNPIVDMTYKEWTAAVSPKVDGAWNLHKALLNQPLDFFIMASSNVTLADEPGQSNYCAANTFLESFCQYRHNLGLPASVLSICAIDGVGFVARNPDVKRKLKSQGFYFLSERELVEYMELAILNSYPPPEETNADSASLYTPWQSSGHVIMGLRSEIHLNDPNCHTSWRRDRRMGHYHNITEAVANDNSANSNALKSFLSRAADDPDILSKKSNIEFLALEIGQKVFKFMLKQEDVDISLSLAQIGMDSLMAIELRRWWKQVFGLDISVLEIMGSGTLEELGKVAAEGLEKKLSSSAAKAKQTRKE